MSEYVDVVVGRLGRARGVRGDIAVEVRTDEPTRRFRAGARLRLQGSGDVVELAAVTWNRGKLFVSLVGYPDRTAVERLTGRLLEARVLADELPSEPEEYFDRQLVGLRVLRVDGSDAGFVAEVLHLPAQDVLGVDVAGGRRLVPFVKDIVVEVDLDAGHLRLADIAGLLEDAE